jgi:ankyrin repeat protein
LPEKGAKANVLDVFGNNALHLAVHGKSPSVVQKLLSAGTDPKQRSNISDKILHCP